MQFALQVEQLKILQQQISNQEAMMIWQAYQIAK